MVAYQESCVWFRLPSSLVTKIFFPPVSSARIWWSVERPLHKRGQRGLVARVAPRTRQERRTWTPARVTRTKSSTVPLLTLFDKERSELEVLCWRSWRWEHTRGHSQRRQQILEYTVTGPATWLRSDTVESKFLFVPSFLSSLPHKLWQVRMNSSLTRYYVLAG